MSPRHEYIGADATLIDAEAAEQLAHAQREHDLRQQQIRDQARHRNRQAEWDGIRAALLADGWQPIKHYDLIDPGGLLAETRYTGSGEAECRLYTTYPYGRNAQHVATYRFNGRNTEPVLPLLRAEIVRQRRKANRMRATRR